MFDKESNNKPFGISLLAKEMKYAYWIALRATKSPSLAEDAVQEACAHFLNHRPQQEGIENMRSYFLSAVHKQALTLLRGETRRRRREEAYANGTPLVAAAEKEAPNTDELARAARAALASLPLDERMAVSLCSEQGFSLQAAAKIAGVPKTTLAGRVNRGLEKLRKILVQQGYSVATPLAVGTALSSLPLPAVPAGLTAALQNLAANPALAAAKAAKLSAKALSQTAAKKTATVWLAFGLTAGAVALAGGVWRTQTNKQSDDTIKTAENPPRASVVAPVEKPNDQKESLKKTERFYRRWSFANGLPEGLDYGAVNNWVSHQSNIGDKRNGIAPALAAGASLSLLCRIPSANSSVTVKAYRLNPVLASGLLTSFGFEGKKPKSAFWREEQLSWHEEPLGTRNAVYIFETYCIGGWAITLCDGKLTCITRYEGERVSLHGVGFGLKSNNLVLEELELRELKNEEIPEFIRDPEKLVKERGLVLREAKDLDRKRGEP
jgi:RNA polymerase sigma-70 factor (ECF subfamily)